MFGETIEDVQAALESKKITLWKVDKQDEWDYSSLTTRIVGLAASQIIMFFNETDLFARVYSGPKQNNLVCQQSKILIKY